MNPIITGPVTLVGAGKMGMALAQGWISAGLTGKDLVLVDPQPQDATRAFADACGARLLGELDSTRPGILVLAVKPQIMGAVLEAVKVSVNSETLIISIAAGVGLTSLETGLGTNRIVRAMPNTPAQIGKGATGAVAGKGVSQTNREAASQLLEAVGKLIWFDDEAMLDAVTAVSGSGPAYIFSFVEALAAAGVAEGLGPEDAMSLARQTVIGAAALLEADLAPASVLRKNVTSPNGTTAAALEVLMGTNGLGPVLGAAVAAARARSEELGRT